MNKIQGSTISDPAQPGSTVREELPDDADRALSTVARKLSGKKSVEHTVNELIMRATDRNALSKIFSVRLSFFRVWDGLLMCVRLRRGGSRICEVVEYCCVSICGRCISWKCSFSLFASHAPTRETRESVQKPRLASGTARREDDTFATINISIVYNKLQPQSDARSIQYIPTTVTKHSERKTNELVMHSLP